MLVQDQRWNADRDSANRQRPYLQVRLDAAESERNALKSARVCVLVCQL